MKKVFTLVVLATFLLESQGYAQIFKKSSNNSDTGTTAIKNPLNKLFNKTKGGSLTNDEVVAGLNETYKKSSKK